MSGAPPIVPEMGEGLWASPTCIPEHRLLIGWCQWALRANWNAGSRPSRAAALAEPDASLLSAGRSPDRVSLRVPHGGRAPTLWGGPTGVGKSDGGDGCRSLATGWLIPALSASRQPMLGDLRERPPLPVATARDPPKSVARGLRLRAPICYGLPTSPPQLLATSARLCHSALDFGRKIGTIAPARRPWAATEPSGLPYQPGAHRFEPQRGRSWSAQTWRR